MHITIIRINTSLEFHNWMLMKMPHDIEKITNTFIELGADIMKLKAPSTPSKRFIWRWRSHFGCSPEISSLLWLALSKHNKVKKKHLLWVLYFLKTYPTESEACSRVGGIDEKAWREIIWEIIYKISILEAKIVSVLFSFLFVYVCLSNIDLDQVQ